MLKVEYLETMGWEAALRGMRNPMNSWAKSTSRPGFICENDVKLIHTLSRAGEDHRKVLRMIHIQCDVTAPLFWWKDYDTYKVGTVANSCSTMHKIHSRPLTMHDFSMESLTGRREEVMDFTVYILNDLIAKYNDEKISPEDRKQAWREIIELLPSSFMQKRTLDLNYETALKILHSRKNHKLKEFEIFRQALLSLPLMEGIYEATKKNNWEVTK